ncbi:MAG: hypothetical protein HKN14_04915 [Marinicaulis sp.]|nr:hypothetical protein [Marinicaulis sp.]NNE40243.1 hypothetical protein [Marinicaulis sp.]NNL90148.1 hypothetical protein [Marinicaulis sp.]
MLETIINDVVNVMQGTFMTGDWTALAVAIGSVLIAVAMMQRGAQIGSMTLLALVIFVIGCIGRGMYLASQATDGAAPSLAARLESSYLEFANLQAGTILAYFIAFMSVLLVLFAAKSLVAR